MNLIGSGTVEALVCFGDAAPQGTIGFAERLDGQSTEFTVVDIELAELSTIAYTSGTTGLDNVNATIVSIPRRFRLRIGIRTPQDGHYRHIGKVAFGGGREFTAYKDLKECRVWQNQKNSPPERKSLL